MTKKTQKENLSCFQDRLIDRNLILLFGLPFLLILLNNSWIFLPGGIDPWVYLGYFLDLKQYLTIFAKTYYGTRLPWILPGFLAYHFFSPLIASYVLHLTVYYAAVISLYFILKHTIGARSALLTAALMGCHYFFLIAAGSNYIDGAGLSYFLLILLMVTYSAKHSSSLWSSLAGCFYGCLIYTQLFLAIYTPLIILYALFIGRDADTLRSLKFFILGFLGLTLCLCTINHSLNGSFFFFLPCWTWLGGFILKGTNPWWSPLSTWWLKTPWLLLPTLVFFASAAILLFRHLIHPFPSRRFLLFFQAYFILNVLMFIALQMVIQQPVLQTSFYASYLLPTMFLAFGSQLALVFNKASSYRLYRTLGPIMVVCFLGTNLSIWDLPPHDAAFNQHSFLSVIKSVRTIQNMDPQGATLFWYNHRASLGPTFRSIASTHLWGYRLVNEDFPDVQEQPFQLLAPGKHLFILSEDQSTLETANQNLAQIGLKGEFVDERAIQQGPINYKITFLKIHTLEK